MEWNKVRGHKTHVRALKKKRVRKKYWIPSTKGRIKYPQRREEKYEEIIM